MTLELRIKQLTSHIENYQEQITLLTQELSRMEQELDELRHEKQSKGGGQDG